MLRPTGKDEMPDGEGRADCDSANGAVPLSLAAEELVGSVRRSAGATDRAVGVFRWLSAVLAHHRELAERASEGVDLGALGAEAGASRPGGEPDPPVSAERVQSEAAVEARNAGRPVIAPQDVVAAILRLGTDAVAEREAGVKSVASEEEDEAGAELAASKPTEPARQASPGEAEAERAARGRGTRTFRVFVSSTFGDLQAERNVLQKVAFPRLREFCARHGARFQAIDLRWGVSEEAAVDQQAMNICLGEIERCHQVTPRPNFLVLLGDRYGWRPPPPQVPAEEFEQILQSVDDSEDRAVLEYWYRRDENADPAEYRLQPRTGPRETYRDAQAWGRVESRIWRVLAAAVRDANGVELDEDRRRVYLASATEQEVFAGALAAAEPEDKVFCFFRTITGYPADDEGNPVGKAERYVSPEPEARARLASLRSGLEAKLPESSVETREVEWGEDGPRFDEACLRGLADWVIESLEGAIRRELARSPRLPAMKGLEVLETDARLAREAAEHLEFAEERCRFFVGREDILQEIGDYLDGGDARPLAIWGEGGTGKSALLAEASRKARDVHRSAAVIARFIGATPGSTDGRDLLAGLCREISLRYEADAGDVPTDYQELVRELGVRMRLASSDRPLIVFIDSLDQLGESGRSLAWIPTPLAAHVRLVVSTRPANVRESLERCGAILRELGAMARDEGGRLLDSWLAAARPRRRLQPRQREAVLEGFIESNGNPLYLKLAFGEARRWRAYRPSPDAPPADELGKQLTPGLPGIIRDNLFSRLADEDNHGEEFVSHALGYLAASRYGLAEDELVDLLSQDPDIYSWFVRSAEHLPPDLMDEATDHWLTLRKNGGRDGTGKPVRRAAVERWLRLLRRDPERLRSFLTGRLDLGDLQLPVVLWSRLAFDLQPYLADRRAEGGDLLAFYHRELAEVARERFLTDELATAIHRRMADYFASRPLSRKLDEYPYQLTRSGQWRRLSDALCDTELFPFAMEHQRGYEWVRYWQPVRDRFDPAHCYEAAIEAKWREEGESQEVARLLNHASRLFELMGLFESALTYRERAFGILEGNLGRGNPALAPHIDNLASLYWRMGKHRKADELSRLAVATHERQAEPDALEEAVFLSNRAMHLKELGQPSEAIPLAERALDIVESVKGPNHPDVVPILSNLSSLYGDAGDIEKATELCARALVIEEHAKGADHPDVGETLNNLAFCYMHSERYAEALACFERALSVFERHLGAQHPNVAGVLSNMGLCHQFMRQHQQALDFLDRALAAERRALGESHPNVAYVLFSMSYNLAMLGDLAEARERCMRAVEIAREVLGDQHPKTLLYVERLEAIEEVLGSARKS